MGYQKDQGWEWMKNPNGTVIWVEHGEWEVNVGGNETDIGGDNISQS